MAHWLAFLFIWHPKRSVASKAKKPKCRHRAALYANPTQARWCWIISQRHRLRLNRTGKKFYRTSGKGLSPRRQAGERRPAKSPSVRGRRPEQSCAARPAGGGQTCKEPAVFGLNRLAAAWLRYSGGPHLGSHAGLTLKRFSLSIADLMKVRFSLVTIAAMMAGIRDPLFRTGYRLRVAFRAHRTLRHPFFGTLLRIRLGVALTVRIR